MVVEQVVVTVHSVCHGADTTLEPKRSMQPRLRSIEIDDWFSRAAEGPNAKHAPRPHVRGANVRPGGVLTSDGYVAVAGARWRACGRRHRLDSRCPELPSTWSRIGTCSGEGGAIR